MTRLMLWPLHTRCRHALAMASTCYHRFSSPAPAPHPNAAASASFPPRPIPSCVAPTVHDFLHGCFQAQTPLLIRGAMQSWASRSWTPESLKATFGHLNVPVELSLWNDEEGRWGDYRDLYKEHTTLAGSKEYFMPHQPMSLADFINIFMGEREDPSSPSPLIGYMAQHQLLSEVPQMADGIP